MQTENLHATDCIRTFSGIYMNVFDPNPEMICIEDIAHALAHQCRFGGHLPRFYSVAQHSVYCSMMSKSEFKLQALMHDASEAYLLDIPSPIKKRLKGYKEMEDRMMALIAQRFGFAFPMEDAVHKTDAFMLQLEWDKIMVENNPTMACWDPETAEETFLIFFNELTKEVTND